MRSVAVSMAVVGCVMVGACGAADVTESSEYLTLLEQNSALTEDLDQLEADAAVSDYKLEQVQVELADEQSAGEDLRSDFRDVLSMIFRSQGGLDEVQSNCVGTVVSGDPEVRGAYLQLIATTDPDSDEAKSALDDLNAVLRECGVDVPDAATDDVAAVEPPAELLAVIRPVDTTGVALPLLSTNDPAADPAIGMAAPVLNGEGYDGAAITVDATRSGPIMLVFLAHWCPHCNVEMPRIQQLVEEGRIPDGVTVMAVSTGVNPAAANFPPDVWLQDMSWTFPTLVDGIDENGVYVAASAFGVSGFPFVALIGADGNVAARWTGERSIDEIEMLLVVSFGPS